MKKNNNQNEENLGNEIDDKLKKKIDAEMVELNRVCKDFSETLIQMGLMTQVLEMAGETLKRKIDTRIFRTELYNEAMTLRQKCYESPLRDLEVLEEKKQDDTLKV